MKQPTSSSKTSGYTPLPRSREPSPTNPLNSNYNYLSSKPIGSRSRDPSPAEPKRIVPPVSYLSSNTDSSRRSKSRDPSPLRNSSYSRLNKDVSGSYTSIKRLSRESSPVEGVVTNGKDKYGFSASYHPSQYQPKVPTTPQYNRTLSSSSFTNSKDSTKLDPCVSYLTSTESKAVQQRRSLSRASSLDRQSSVENSYDKTNKEIQRISSQIERFCNGHRQTSLDDDLSPEKSLSPKLRQTKVEPKIMIKVEVVTRGTSPTKPTTEITRARRTETVAKTIEKTITRPFERPKMLDKEIQSDRLDDTSRTSRFVYSPRSTYSGSYSSSRSTRPTRDFSSVSSSSPTTTTASTSGSGRSSSNSASKSSKNDASPTQIPKSSSKSNSSEASNCTSPLTNGCLKYPNKDFRKSALNMGQPDRSRKESSTPTTPTTPTSSDPTKQVQILFDRERSSSTESDSSTASSLSVSDSKQEKQLQKSARTSVSIDEMPTAYVNDESEKSDKEKKSLFLRVFDTPITIKKNKSSSSVEQNWPDDTTISESLNDTERIWSPETNVSVNSRGTPGLSVCKEGSPKGWKQMYTIQRIQSGEKAWWQTGDTDKSGKTSRNSVRWTEEENSQVTEELERVLGASDNKELGETEGVQNSRKSPYDNVPQTPKTPEGKIYISRHSNIDDILGGTTSLCNAFSPISDRIFQFEECFEISPDQVKIHDSSPQMPIIRPVLT